MTNKNNTLTNEKDDLHIKISALEDEVNQKINEVKNLKQEVDPCKLSLKC